MARPKVSMPFKIALLLFAGVLIIAFSGYLSYKIDTINALVAAKTQVWREMIFIWQYDSTRIAISDLAERFQAVEPDTVVKQGFYHIMG